MSTLFLINFTVFFNPMLDFYSNSFLHIVLELENITRTASVTFLAFIICVLTHLLVSKPEALQFLFQLLTRCGHLRTAVVALLQFHLQMGQLLLRSVKNHPELLSLHFALLCCCPLQTQEEIGYLTSAWAGTGCCGKAKQECCIPVPEALGSLFQSA